MNEQLAILALFVFFYSVLSGRFERSIISGPMVFVVAGFIMGPVGLGWFNFESARLELRTLADLTLVMFLFIDASNADLVTLRRRFGIPSRMLLIGLPGTFALGFGLALIMFDVLSVYEAALLGIILSATDAALGKAVVSNKAVPARIREGLNVESGLNDGLCVPILFVFIALELDLEQHSGSQLIIHFLSEELGIGLAVGLVVAGIGTWVMKACLKLGWISEIWIQISVIALAFACFSVAQSLGGSGYIAAFTGGMFFGYRAKGSTHEIEYGTEVIGETLALLTWLLFGAAVVGRVLVEFTWPIIFYAVLSLTIVRMLPIYISLAGSGEKPYSRLFLGWFGPRGLASIVFAVIVLDEGLEGAGFIAVLVACTVILSLIAHGISANPLVKWLIARERAEPAGKPSDIDPGPV